MTHIVIRPARSSSLLSTGDVVVEDDNGDWFVCATCDSLIEKRNVDSMLDMAEGSVPLESRGDFERSMLRPKHERLVNTPGTRHGIGDCPPSHLS